MNNRINLISFIAFFLISSSILAQFSNGYELNAPIRESKDIELADLDGDGLADIIVAHKQIGMIGWFRNIDGYQFELLQDIGNPLTPFSLSSGDVDNDGDIDIFASSIDYGIKWYKNDGAGNFDAPTQMSTTNSAHIQVADLNEDGLVDLLIGTQNNGVAWFENLGEGLFSSEQVIGTALYSLEEVMVADLDGDLDLDVISVSSSPDKLAWYENLGAGSFGPKILISQTQYGALGGHTADLDNDGDQDIVLSGQINNTISWYENLGGIFSGENLITSDALAVEKIVCADMNGDGNIDVIANSSDGAFPKLGWFENIGGGIFSGFIKITDVSYSSSIRSADMDNDGDMDVVSVNADESEVAYHNNPGYGDFGIDNRLRIEGTIRRGKPLDVNQDGELDVLITSGEVFWCENLGDGKFGAVKNQIYPYAAGSDMGDIDNDGDLDLVMANGVSQPGYANVLWLENLGNGTFGTETAITENAPSSKLIEVVDLNEDGLQDILVGSDGQVAWYQNLGGNNFSTTKLLGDVQGCNSMETVDLNNDGLLDVLYVSYYGNAVFWNENLGGSDFGPQTVINNSQMEAHGTTASDIDDDGDLDVFVASKGNDKVVWFENLGDGFFGSENIVTTSLTDPSDVQLSDFDLDGDMDLAVGLGTAGSLVNAIYWFENLGGGTFGTSQLVGNQAPDLESIEAADFDGDGDIDILSVHHYTSILWHENYFISNMQIKGRIFIDENVNGLFEPSEATIPNLALYSYPSAGYSYTYADGRYFMLFEGLEGNFEIIPQPLQYWNISTDSLSYHITVSPDLSSISDLDFGFYTDTLVQDIDLALIGGFPRCNSPVNYWIDLENIGTTSPSPSGIIHLELDDSLDYLFSSLVPDSVLGKNLYWNYDSLEYFETMRIVVYVQMPDFNSMGDNITSYVNLATTDSLGTILYTSSKALSQIVTCAYDPNDKNAFPSGDEQGYIWPAPEKIEYTIRFQNTGTDTALNVIIRDQLDANLVWNSLRPIASSHPMNIEMTPGGEVSFIFADIMLPDSNVNELASHGFVRYSIDVVEGLAIESQISNTANIFFDMNPAVVTNTVIHILDTLDSGSTNDLFEMVEGETLSIYPNPFDDCINVYYSNMNVEKYSLTLLDIHGRELHKTEYSNQQLTKLQIGNLDKSVYFLRAIDENNQLLFIRKVVRH